QLERREESQASGPSSPACLADSVRASSSWNARTTNPNMQLWKDNHGAQLSSTGCKIQSFFIGILPSVMGWLGGRSILNKSIRWIQDSQLQLLTRIFEKMRMHGNMGRSRASQRAKKPCAAELSSKQRSVNTPPCSMYSTCLK